MEVIRNSDLNSKNCLSFSLFSCAALGELTLKPPSSFCNEMKEVVMSKRVLHNLVCTDIELQNMFFASAEIHTGLVHS